MGPSGLGQSSMSTCEDVFTVNTIGAKKNI